MLPTGIFAVLTAITHALRILDWSFQIYLALSVVATLAVIGLWIAYVRAELKEIEIRDYRVLVGVLFIGMVGVVAASIYNLPDSDDVQYVPNAVHYLTYPDDQMGNQIHYIYKEDGPILSVVVATAQPFEFAQTLLAILLNVEYLFIYHILMVALAGFAIPLASFLVASHLSKNSSHAALAVLFVLAVSTLLGETKFSIGNFGITRLFQGKVVLVAAGLPFFVALSLDYLSIPTIRNWFLVFLIAVALSGLTATAFFMVPMVALAVGISYLVTANPNLKGVRSFVAYGLALIYLVVYGLYASSTVAQFRNVENPLLDQWPSDFSSHLREMIDVQRPATPLAFGASILLVVILIKDSRKRFLMIWTGVSILAYTNAVSGQFWIDHVVGPSIYKRVFFVLPIYPMVGLAAIGGREHFDGASRRRGAVLLASLFILLTGLHFVPKTTSIYGGGGELGSFGYKLNSTALELSQWVVDNIPPGPMLAPPDIAGAIGMLSGGYPQMHLQNRPLLEWLPWAVAQNREWASYFSDGDAAKEESFRLVVEETDELRTIVIRNDRVPDVLDLFESIGFAVQHQTGIYTVLSR